MKLTRRELLGIGAAFGLAGCSELPPTSNKTMTDRTPRYFNDNDELTADVNNESTATNEIGGGVTSSPITNFEGDNLTVDGSGNLNAAGGGGSGGKPYATVVVAASDANSTTGADYVCDGVDDQITINNAIADLPSGGGSVVLTEGTFTVSGSVTPVSNMTLRGQGRGTLIQAGAGVTSNVVDNSGSDVEITQLRIDGNAANNTGDGNTETQCGIYTHADRIRVARCWITNTVGASIRHNGANSQIQIVNNVIDNTTGGPSNRADLISLTNGTSDAYIGEAVIANNHLSNCSHESVEVSRVHGVTIANNYIKDGADLGISLHSGSTGTNGSDAAYSVIASGNVIENVSDCGIAMEGDEMIAIGNSIFNTTAGPDNVGIGIDTAQATQSWGSNLLIVGNTVVNSADDGIRLERTDSLAGMNIVDGSGASGIDASNVSGAMVANNIVRNSTAQDITGDAGANIIRGNLSSDGSGKGFHVATTEPTNLLKGDIWFDI